MTAPEHTLRSSDLAVEGMTCSACARSVEEGLSRHAGVAAAHVNFATGVASVRFDGTVDVDELRATIESLGYRAPVERDHDAAEAEREADLWNRLRLAAALTVPLMAISMLMPLRFRGWEWVAAALATPVVFGAGWRFHRVAAGNLAHRLVTMDTLVSVGTIAAWTWSTVVLVAGIDEPIYFETGAVIITLILLGKWFEVRATRRSGDAIRALADLGARTAVLEDGTEIAIDDLAVGMRFRVKPGERIATDGVVVGGRGAIDASVVTGESVPVEVGEGDTVVGASINTDGSLLVEARRVGADTALAQIVKLVQEAQNSKAPSQLLADRASQWLVLIAVIIGLATFSVWFWWIGSPLLFAVTLTITVFVIACPDALGLATPMAVMVGTGIGARNGILFKNAGALEEATKLDVIVFDKTGTLTMGKPRVVDVVPAEGTDADTVLRMAAAVERGSDHPLALAIIERAEGLDVPATGAFLNIEGKGAQAEIEGELVYLGNRRLMDEQKIDLADLSAAADDLKGEGRTVVHVARGGRLLGLVAIADAPRPSAKVTVAKLRERGVEVAMLTGDNEGTAKRIAAELGIDIILADVLPGQKADKVKELQEQGKRVGMVGDGVNDAPALTQADVGFAIGAGTDVAMESADVVLMKSDPHDVLGAIELSRATLRKMHQNLFWAVAYNVVAFPAAAGVFYPLVVSPAVAAIAMSGSSALVAVNALLLKRTRLDGVKQPGQPEALVSGVQAAEA